MTSRVAKADFLRAFMRRSCDDMGHTLGLFVLQQMVRMNGKLGKLIEHLSLERIEENLYRGPSADLGWGRVYGGQVLAQAIQASAATVSSDHRIHSMHAYFLLAGDVNIPVLYDVDRIRNGRSFTTRRTVAIQHGEAILNMAASFQKWEPGFEHQIDMPDVPPPERVESDHDRNMERAQSLPPFIRKLATLETPFEIRTLGDLVDPIAPEIRPATRKYWLRTTSALPDDYHLHCTLLAYASDHNFLTTALQPHGVTWLTPRIQLASLDHTIWFHHDFRIDDWLLYVIESPAAAHARGLVLGRFYNQDGVLVASTAQEGLMRTREP